MREQPKMVGHGLRCHTSMDRRSRCTAMTSSLRFESGSSCSWKSAREFPMRTQRASFTAISNLATSWLHAETDSAFQRSLTLELRNILRKIWMPLVTQRRTVYSLERSRIRAPNKRRLAARTLMFAVIFFRLEHCCTNCFVECRI